MEKYLRRRLDCNFCPRRSLRAENAFTALFYRTAHKGQFRPFLQAQTFSNTASGGTAFVFKFKDTAGPGERSDQGARMMNLRGTISAGQAATVQIVVTPRTPGTITNTVSGTATEADAIPVNNTASQTTQILGVGASSVPALSGLALALLSMLVLVMGAALTRARS